jgi:hypothetical protein
MNRGVIYQGSGYPSGSDFSWRPAIGMFIDPNDPNQWCSAPYNDEQRKYVKDHNYHWDLMNKIGHDVDAEIIKIQNKTSLLTSKEREYLIKIVEDEKTD